MHLNKAYPIYDMKSETFLQLLKDDMIKNNYRPVSILSVFSNVFEKIVAE